ncbi:hypothetical protein FDUTEX481_07089 [Tolypothrix sp. PCC 7601]|nr:hypothetical protein FDUTEX481_07089 [Tolypothrix sp. PCC 7601]
MLGKGDSMSGVGWVEKCRRAAASRSLKAFPKGRVNQHPKNLVLLGFDLFNPTLHLKRSSKLSYKQSANSTDYFSLLQFHYQH